jgi:hypothetical protein
MIPAACGGGSADRDGSGACLLGLGGQAGLQAQRREADPGELVEARLVLADAGQQLRGLLGGQLLVACSVMSGPMVGAFARSGTTASRAATSGRSTSNQSTVGGGSIPVDRAHADAAPCSAPSGQPPERRSPGVTDDGSARTRGHGRREPTAMSSAPAFGLPPGPDRPHLRGAS